VDPHLAPITLSLNSSATYLGAALGAGLGSATVRFGSLTMIGTVSALCELVAIGFLVATQRRAVARLSQRGGNGGGYMFFAFKPDLFLSPDAYRHEVGRRIAAIKAYATTDGDRRDPHSGRAQLRDALTPCARGDRD
jgi:hypothetical protein